MVGLSWTILMNKSVRREIPGSPEAFSISATTTEHPGAFPSFLGELGSWALDRAILDKVVFVPFKFLI